MDPRLVLGLITSRDLASEAAWRQRPPVVKRGQLNRMLVDSFRRLAGDPSDAAEDDSPLPAEPDARWPVARRTIGDQFSTSPDQAPGFALIWTASSTTTC